MVFLLGCGGSDTMLQKGYKYIGIKINSTVVCTANDLVGNSKRLLIIEFGEGFFAPSRKNEIPIVNFTVRGTTARLYYIFSLEVKPVAILMWGVTHNFLN